MYIYPGNQAQGHFRKPTSPMGGAPLGWSCQGYSGFQNPAVKTRGSAALLLGPIWVLFWAPRTVSEGAF